MPVQLTTIGLTATSTAGSIDLSRMQISALPRSAEGPFAHLELINESATGLLFTFPNTGATWPVPAGKSRVIPIPPGESKATWTVLNSYPTAYSQSCFVFYFEFNEEVIDLGQVGAAQIGNQSRTVTLPLTPFARSSFILSPITGSDSFLRIINLSATNIANLQANGYLFYFEAEEALPGVAGVVNSTRFTGYIEVYDATPAVIAGPTQIFSGQCYSALNAAGDTATSRVFSLPTAVPLLTEFSYGPTAATWRIRLHIEASTAGLFMFNFAYELDSVNKQNPGTYGNFLNNSGTF